MKSHLLSGLAVILLAGCGSDDGDIELRAATSDECPFGGTALLSKGKVFPVCDGDGQGPQGADGQNGAAGPMGPQGPMGPTGPAASAGLGDIVGSAGCYRFEDETSFSYGFSLVIFSSGASFADISFDTMLTSGNTSHFYAPGVDPSATFVDGVDADFTRLDGVFEQTINLTTRRWSMSQGTNMYMDVPIADGALCSETWDL